MKRSWNALVMILIAAALSAQASAELKPAKSAHEVKVPLKDTVVNGEQLPQRLIDVLNLPVTFDRVRMEFLDTTDNADAHAPWIIRRRSKQSGAVFENELTIKRRFKVENQTFEAAVTAAKGALASVQGKLKYQGEWSPGKLTLSVAAEHELKSQVENLGDDLEFRDLAGQIAMTKIGPIFPPVFLARSRVFGPVSGQRYEGTLPNVGAVTLEVFRVVNAQGPGFDYLTEVSAKADTVQEAMDKLAALKAAMQKENWLDENPESKTAAIISRYSRSEPKH